LDLKTDKLFRSVAFIEENSTNFVANLRDGGYVIMSNAIYLLQRVPILCYLDQTDSSKMAQRWP